jgi:hypothetical protein
MARPTLSSHPKFAKLSARLRSRALARGVLELIWETCYASGEPLVGDHEALEAIADWRGEPGELAAALLQSGFIDLQVDANGEQLLAVHDLEDHAPDYVLKRWEREAKRKEKGLTLREIRQEAARRSWTERDANVRRLQANVAPPTPAPAPAPAQDPPPRAHTRSNDGAGSPGDPRLPDGPVTGSWLCEAFGRVRAMDTGGLPWDKPASREGRATDMAELINATPDCLADVIPSMHLLFTWAKTNPSLVGKRVAEVLKSASFGFAVWCTEFTTLREALHGRTPKVPSAPSADARCAFHRQGFRNRLPREGAHDGCPECKHAQAAQGIRTGEPSSLADLAAATDRRLAEQRKAGERAATAEELAELRAARQPAKAATA